VRNEDVLQRVKKKRNIVQTIKRTVANWIGHILRKKLPSKTSYKSKYAMGRRGRRYK